MGRKQKHSIDKTSPPRVKSTLSSSSNHEQRKQSPSTKKSKSKRRSKSRDSPKGVADQFAREASRLGNELSTTLTGWADRAFEFMFEGDGFYYYDNEEDERSARRIDKALSEVSSGIITRSSSGFTHASSSSFSVPLSSSDGQQQQQQQDDDDRKNKAIHSPPKFSPMARMRSRVVAAEMTSNNNNNKSSPTFLSEAQIEQKHRRWKKRIQEAKRAEEESLLTASSRHSTSTAATPAGWAGGGLAACLALRQHYGDTATTFVHQQEQHGLLLLRHCGILDDTLSISSSSSSSSSSAVSSSSSAAGGRPTTNNNNTAASPSRKSSKQQEQQQQNENDKQTNNNKSSPRRSTASNQSPPKTQQQQQDNNNNDTKSIHTVDYTDDGFADGSLLFLEENTIYHGHDDNLPAMDKELQQDVTTGNIDMNINQNDSGTSSWSSFYNCHSSSEETATTSNQAIVATASILRNKNKNNKHYKKTRKKRVQVLGETTRATKTAQQEQNPDSSLLDDSPDKDFIHAFIKQISTVGRLFLWHQPTDGKTFHSPIRVIVLLERGGLTSGFDYSDDATRHDDNGRQSHQYSGPRLAWYAKQSTKHHTNDNANNKLPPNAGELLGTLDLLEIKSLAKATPLQLIAFPFAMPGNCLILRLDSQESTTTTNNEVQLKQDIVLEASNDEEARRFIHGLRWIVARLAFHLVLGNSYVCSELFLNDDNDEDCFDGQPSAVRAMNDVSNQLVEKCRSGITDGSSR